MVKKLSFMLVFLVLAVLAISGVASAHGVSPAQLSSSGWMCVNVPGLGVHCFAPGAFRSSPSVQVLVFDTTDPGAVDAPFHGTEILIRDDIYKGQPCPTEGIEEYTLLPADETPFPVDYRACHH